MTNFTTEIKETLILKGNLDDLFFRHLELASNSLVQAGLIAFFDYENEIVRDLIHKILIMGIIHVYLKKEYGKLNLIISIERTGEFTNKR